MTPIKALDFSNWTRVPTQDDLQTLWALGYRHAIVGASFNVTLARQQLAALADFGFKVSVYAWLRHPVRYDLLQNAIDACAGFPVERMWLDVEDADDALGKSPSQLASDVWAALGYMRPQLTIEIGIYTGSWFWDDYMETTETFGCRLWLANYVTTPNTTFIYAHLPGGWVASTLVIWQWNNHLAGTDFNADDNLILAEVIDMTPEETNAAIRAYVDPKATALYMNALQNGKDILAQGASIRALALAFADHVQQDSVPTNAPLPADLVAELEAIKTRQTDLEARAAAAAAALAPPQP